jgi:hypothetical protein
VCLKQDEDKSKRVGGLGVRQHQRDQRAQRAKSGTIKSLVNLYLLYSLVC